MGFGLCARSYTATSRILLKLSDIGQTASHTVAHLHSHSDNVVKNLGAMTSMLKKRECDLT